ncbi:MAG TPA: alpha/beta hydrolase [Solirubrobacteraceae bacterium]|nr:alpha/beta hydrolase [Solirubrobacteraceae bacterium]
MDPIGKSPAYAVLPGSGSAGLVWEQAAAELENATVLPLPDAPDVATMSDALAPRIERLSAPRVLVGSSLGALVALDLAGRVAVDGLVLIAAGFGIRVHPSVLARIADDPPGLMEEMARGVVADPDQRPVTELIRRDHEACGQTMLLNHMRVLAAHRPTALTDPPPTLVVWGVRDPGVPLSAHAELALRCRGLLVPISDAGHLPYLEQPLQTVPWIRWAGAVAARQREATQNSLN